MAERRLIAIQGVVQGVGFRPYVHRLAAARGLRGSVRNDASGVTIDIEGDATHLDDFERMLAEEPPPLAAIESFAVMAAAFQSYGAFRIEPSEASAARDTGAAFAPIPADVATCDACLVELFDPANRRFRHPFITCTACGPRLTVVRGTPYDRERTTMAAFAMCDACRREYQDPSDRRFHAESIACPSCGPTLTAARPDATGSVRGADALDTAVRALIAGQIVAIKALGGYHLACDATSDAAVARLRHRKQREVKPLAVMVRDAAAASALCALSLAERRLLESPARPIVLLAKHPGASTAAAVAPGQRTLGVMLPSTPLHHLLLAALDRPLVMTSGNRTDEPVAIDEETAHTALAHIADLFLSHDRPIAVRCDDSVARVAAGDVQMVRRARGYAPRMIPLRQRASIPVLALGGHFKNTVCVARGSEAILSPHVGDLETLAARQSLRSAVDTTLRFAGVTPGVIAHDLHPEYASTQTAHALAAELGVDRQVAVQHHHAHIAACVAEHGVAGPVIGVAFDGTGLGTDGAIWGGEFLLVDGPAFERRGHLAYVPLPGGDAAARRPWMSAAAHVAGAGARAARPVEVAENEWDLVQQLLARSDGQPRTSSIGRLFDAVASLLGVRHVSRYEGEAAMALEAVADPRAKPRYPVSRLGTGGDAAWTADPGGIIRGVLADRARGRLVPEIAGAFHLALGDLIVAGCDRIRAESGVGTVALGGGVFMNALLLTLSHDALIARGFRVLVPRLVPCNDGGLSLGQAHVASLAIREDVCA